MASIGLKFKKLKIKFENLDLAQPKRKTVILSINFKSKKEESKPEL
jgi:hypothetical protein